ncbi:hypothetical protein DFP73DRAFT_533907 [Morchella snyderi]|nr:hypothetical protein DFP73DRAFT_533907 [Morchella snyderi]
MVWSLVFSFPFFFSFILSLSHSHAHSLSVTLFSDSRISACHGRGRVRMNDGFKVRGFFFDPLMSLCPLSLSPSLSLSYSLTLTYSLDLPTPRAHCSQ